ncbi:hypothetical protein RG963_07775 [Methanosarcina sp. Z-7115]|uniref:Uncharacterized protein n=1 Tax=Methanosarcina baikalica TaxID=3073890 RepID=A0ABU2D111_9EURY|nr:hypothetical protein [Methanosarcina sp. Z-7115]MDR7665671.1 hypothetical protein [Methanosarcina sp. Z-7115]
MGMFVIITVSATILASHTIAISYSESFLKGFDSPVTAYSSTTRPLPSIIRSSAGIRSLEDITRIFQK